MDNPYFASALDVLRRFYGYRTSGRPRSLSFRACLAGMTQLQSCRPVLANPSASDPGHGLSRHHSCHISSDLAHEGSG